MVFDKLRFSGFKYAHQDTELVHTFYNYTVITGDNYSGKTTILEAICWCFTGCNLTGNSNYSQNLLNNQSETMYVEVDFFDNNGNQHSLKRIRGEHHELLLNGEKVSQGIIDQKFIYSKSVFLSVLNPVYFLGLLSKDARELIQAILPPIETGIIMKILADEKYVELSEKNVDDSAFYLKRCRSRFTELENEEKYLRGQISALKAVPNTDAPKKPGNIDISKL